MGADTLSAPILAVCITVVDAGTHRSRSAGLIVAVGDDPHRFGERPPPSLTDPLAGAPSGRATLTFTRHTACTTRRIPH